MHFLVLCIGPFPFSNSLPMVPTFLVLWWSISMSMLVEVPPSGIPHGRHPTPMRVRLMSPHQTEQNNRLSLWQSKSIQRQTYKPASEQSADRSVSLLSETLCSFQCHQRNRRPLSSCEGFPGWFAGGRNLKFLSVADLPFFIVYLLGTFSQ